MAVTLRGLLLLEMLEQSRGSLERGQREHCTTDLTDSRLNVPKGLKPEPRPNKGSIVSKVSTG